MKKIEKDKILEIENIIEKIEKELTLSYKYLNICKNIKKDREGFYTWCSRNGYYETCCTSINYSNLETEILYFNNYKTDYEFNINYTKRYNMLLRRTGSTNLWNNWKHIIMKF